VAGGERSLFQGQFRHASRFGERLGVKVSGQYFRANDWETRDSVEERARRACLDAACLQRIGARDFDAERWGGEARLDFRPADNAELIFSAGLNQLGNSIELTGAGAGQARDWRYSYLQGRFRMGRLFAQAFLNQSDAGDTYLLRTGLPIVDKSRLWVGQLQHGSVIGETLDLIYGADLQLTQPDTEGPITGRNEDDDGITEFGGYLHGTLALSPNLDLVAAVRADHHSRLDEFVYSPRAALVFRPLEEQTFRVTFNRAFSTPTTNNLFLDLVASRIGIPPSSPIFNYDVRLTGVPQDGFTFANQCPSGVQQLCMFSPLNPGNRLPANAVPFWNPIISAAAPAPIRALLLDPGRPGDPALGTLLRRLDFEAAQSGVGDPFPVDALGPSEIERLRPTITNTFEVGYKGILTERLLVAADVWSSRITDFVGPLRVETPSVFFNPSGVQAFVTHRLQQALAAGLVTPAQVAQIIAGISAIPVGTVAPDQASSPDLIVTYRNFGELDLWGTDLSFQFLATDQLSLLGGFSFVDESCFDLNEDGSCSTSADLSLNAPKVKGSFGARWSSAVLGLTLEGRVRHNGEFLMNSGAYVGQVDSYTLVDANASYRIPWVPGATATLTVNNLLDERHLEAIGAPELGRLAMVQLTYRLR
jgi:iron complex outermembrane receptor protein